MSKTNVRSMSITSQESYSAVMIADLVAEVPVNPESEQVRDKTMKEETNLAYDGHLDGESKNPAADGIDMNGSHISNGGSIGRGVILSIQFGQPDLKTKSEEKNIQMSTTLPVPSLPQQISESKGFKDMSFLRKIAFGASFLPSVLFVLCFAIILPCIPPKPCIEELWLKTYNNTEPMSRLQISQNIMFTAFKEHQSILMKLNKDSGKEEDNTLVFDTNSAYLKCGNIVTANSTDCIVMNGDGKFYTFNDTHSELLWNPISEDEKASDPILLPDCNGDGTEEIALVVSNSKIKIMYSVATASTLQFSYCDSVPTKLTSWVVNGSAALVFICEKDGEDKLVKIPYDMWCPYSENPQNEALMLHTGAKDSLDEANILPVEDGLALWFEDEISMILPNGSISWTFSDESHSKENRFILYGNFKGENKHVAVLSSSISSGFKVTFLNSLNGSFIKSTNFSDFEAIDVETVRGGKKDFIIILKKKTEKPTDMLSTALTQINDFSTTIVNLVSNEEIRSIPELLLKHEVSFLDTDGNTTIVSLKELTDLQNVEYKTTITAVYNEEKDVLSIYLLSTSENNATVKTTKVRTISIANWNQSKHSKCTMKKQSHSD